MDKSTILKAFNNQFEEFLEDVEVLFPENNDIKTTKTALNMMRKANPKRLCDVWYRYICTKYGEEISKGNIDYFLSKDYSNEFKMDESQTNKVLEAIDKIKGPIQDLDESNKDKCIQYLKNLNQLCQIYYS